MLDNRFMYPETQYLDGDGSGMPYDPDHYGFLSKHGDSLGGYVNLYLNDDDSGDSNGITF